MARLNMDEPLVGLRPRRPLVLGLSALSLIALTSRGKGACRLRACVRAGGRAAQGAFFFFSCCGKLFVFSNILHLVFRCVVLERREAASGIISQMDTSDLLKNMSYQRLSCAQGNDCHCCSS